MSYLLFGIYISLSIDLDRNLTWIISFSLTGPLQSEEQRLKFISTLSDAKKQILEAKNELEKV